MSTSRRTAAEAFDQARLARRTEHHIAHDVAIGQHGHDDLGGTRQLRQALGGAAADLSNKVRSAPRRPVEHHQLRVAFHQMAGHRPAHMAEADKADGR